MHPFTHVLAAAVKCAAAGFGYLCFAGLSTWAAEKDNRSLQRRLTSRKAKHVIFLAWRALLPR
jgi:hypothetical protein